jgi:hypothetical protein
MDAPTLGRRLGGPLGADMSVIRLQLVATSWRHLSDDVATVGPFQGPFSWCLRERFPRFLLASHQEHEMLWTHALEHSSLNHRPEMNKRNLQP